MGEELVLFSWTHFMLSSIQHGIQHGHCTDEMSGKYQQLYTRDLPTELRHKRYWEWLRNWKTVNVRNGGDQQSLIDIVKLFQRPDNPYPWGQFREDKSLNECLTCVSIVVPEHVFAWEPVYEGGFPVAYGNGEVKNLTNKLDSFDQELYNLIKSTRHAT